MDEALASQQVRLFEADLTRLADGTQVRWVSVVEMRALSIFKARVGVNYVSWTPAGPAFLEQIEIDTRKFRRQEPHGDFLAIMHVPTGSLVRAFPMAAESKASPVKSWVMPNHGVTIVWQSALAC
jgi:hypothetical protein